MKVYYKLDRDNSGGKVWVCQCRWGAQNCDCYRDTNAFVVRYSTEPDHWIYKFLFWLRPKTFTEAHQEALEYVHKRHEEAIIHDRLFKEIGAVATLQNEIAAEIARDTEETRASLPLPRY